MQQAKEAMSRQALERLMAQAGTTGASPSASRGAAGAAADSVGSGGGRGGGSGGLDGGYIAQVRSLIRSRTRYVGSDEGNPRAVFGVQVLPDCSIASVRLKRSSGVPAWDQAAERAIEAASPLPRQRDGSCPTELAEISHGPRD